MRFDRTIKIVNNQKGMALVSALMLGLIGMLMVASLLFMVDTGTWLSGSKKRYQMALDTAHGGINFFTKEVIQRGLGGTGLDAMGNYGGIFTTDPGITNAQFNTKLTTRGDIRDRFWPYDPDVLPNSAVPFNATDATVTLAFPNSPNISVSTTIVSTSRGNSGLAANNLQGGGVVNNNAGTITPQHIPYLYQTESQGQNVINPVENARLSAVYVY
ncbi:MAG: hypothetical protein VR65_07610 [Desulfobulbaceae bacterium BRH_c16a]|nr:MAG: hypothetical protein VR65_07610 [Desulfobulbaceae bacterium BRH_c16a]